jgi:hypothetical protein
MTNLILASAAFAATHFVASTPLRPKLLVIERRPADVAPNGPLQPK